MLTKYLCICGIKAKIELFVFSLFRRSNFTCFGHICSPSSGGVLYICNNWYVLCFLVDCLLAGRASRQSNIKHCQISTVSDNFKPRHSCMEGPYIKLQNSGLQYSNAAVLRIRSVMFLSKTPVSTAAILVLQKYVTVHNYEDNLENLCLNGNIFHLRSCRNSGGQSSPSEEGEIWVSINKVKHTFLFCTLMYYLGNMFRIAVESSSGPYIKIQILDSS